MIERRNEMNARIVVRGVVVAVTLSLAGCGTAINMCRPQGEDKPPCMHIYGGIEADNAFIQPNDTELVLQGHGNYAMRDQRMILLPFVLLDLPLSFIGDTLTLPVTIPMTIYDETHHQNPMDNPHGAR
jgi:uncharacterized protein YceK